MSFNLLLAASKRPCLSGSSNELLAPGGLALDVQSADCCAAVTILNEFTSAPPIR